MGEHGFQYKTISKKDLQANRNNDWILHRKKHYIITYLSDLFLRLSTDHKIRATAIIIGSFISVLAKIFG